MSPRSLARWVLVCVASVPFAGSNTATTSEPSTDGVLVERAYQANNVGVGWLEQFNYDKAAAQFQDALRLNPSLGIARFNLALAYFYDSQPDAAEREAREAARLMPTAPQPQFLLGLVARSRNRVADAAAAFSRVLQVDPADVGANIGLGQVRLQQGDAPGAAAAFERAVHTDPSNATAAYNLSISLTRAGRTEEGRQMLERFQALRESGTATTLSNVYLQQGRYAEALVSTGAEPDLVVPGTPGVTFVDEPLDGATPARAGPPRAPAHPAGHGASLQGGLAAADVDQDGDLDLVEIAPERERLWRNDGHGRFTAGTQPPFPRPRGSVGIGAVAGDLTNDGRSDLLVLRLRGTAIYRNEGGGRFADVTIGAGLRLGDDLPATAALVDVDHDGDLDMLVGGFVSLARPPTPNATTADTRHFPEQFPAAPARVYRNDGNGRFTDVTKASGVTASRLIGIVPTDFDARRDVDLLTLSSAGPLTLFRNLRDGTFADVARDAGLPDGRPWAAVSAADLDKDGGTDYYLGRVDGPGLFAMSAALGRFRTEAAPAMTSGTRAALLLDYDNDGLLDLIMSTPSGARLLRNEGKAWHEVTDRALPATRTAAVLSPIAGGRLLLAADVDDDGDTDIVLRYAGGVHLWRNQGGSAQRSFTVRLAGRVSNRSGTGATIEMRAGSLRERRETTAVTPPTGTADLVFGLGARTSVDVVRVLWPSGILQAELTPAGEKGAVLITELDRKPSSCPFLFTWNGRAFEFITDFLGGGELGYWAAPGVRGRPDSDEVVRIPGDRLAPRAGRYDLRITNELEEVLFLDSARLHVVDHPADVAVFADEGLLPQPRAGMRLIALRTLRLPATASDDHGRDVTALVAEQDFRAPGFPLAGIRGYAAPHTLTLTPQEGSRADWLVLSGWTDYAYSSDNVAASQAGLQLRAPALEVRDANGMWRTTRLEVPVPAGRPQTVLVDLRGGVPAVIRAFRIRTNMRVHWDQVRFATAADDVVLQTRELRPAVATLQGRGFSREHRPAAAGPLLYEYGEVSRVSPWKQFIGASTASGPITVQLAATDDRFAVAVAGDEIALSFDAGDASAPAPGRMRTFLLHADGFSKEMDLHSASPDTIGPLPFHGMRTYPPSPADARPARDQGEPDRVRHSVRSVPALESLLIHDVPVIDRAEERASSASTPNREAHR